MTVQMPAAPALWAREPQFREAKPRILFLLSHEMDLKFLQRHFELHPGMVIDAEWTTSFGVAVGKLESGVYHVLVAGLDSACHHGLQLVLAIRDRFPALPVLVLTRDGQAALGREAVRLGASEAISEGQLQGPSLSLHLRRIMLEEYWSSGVATTRPESQSQVAPC